MKYFIYRIQAATLSREVTDHLPPSYVASPGIDSSDEVYNTIILLDQKYQQFIKSLPSFYQLNMQHDTIGPSLLQEKPYLGWQRYMINFMVHTRLARLHAPFLIRGSTQHKFAYSRMQCIRSAETILEIRKIVIDDQNVGGLTYFLAQFLMAAVILVIDLCYNPGEIRASQRKQDVLQACRVLEEDLNAKTLTKNGREKEGFSRGQLLLKSFRKAVQTLRGMLRKTQSGNKLQQLDGLFTDRRVNDPSANEVIMFPNSQRRSTRHSVTSNQDSSRSVNQIIDSQLQVPVNAHTDPSTSHDQDSLGHSNELQRLYPPNPPPPYDRHDSSQHEGTQVAGEFIVDDLWEDLFTVGPSFNDTDWGQFISDMDDQMGGHE
jgi:hypothetical protein